MRVDKRSCTMQGHMGAFDQGRGVLSRCSQYDRVKAAPCFSGRLCACGSPVGHGLTSMISNLCSGAVGLGWNEEVSDGGEDRHEMLQ